MERTEIEYMLTVEELIKQLQVIRFTYGKGLQVFYATDHSFCNIAASKVQFRTGVPGNCNLLNVFIS